MVKKKEHETTATGAPAIIEGVVHESDLRKKLETLKNHNGVLGYIMRNSTYASIDLDDPTKIMDYALLSSSIVDACEEISQICGLGGIKSIVVEGKNVKMLVLTANEKTISVFMEKNVDSELLRKILF
jgi:predicted regulator of Ras-like GTPase activity (Roadblock/LC7/MglB family)